MRTDHHTPQRNRARETQSARCFAFTLTVDRTGTGSGRIQGIMAFDRKDYGMDSNIPFIRIAHRAEVDVDLTATRIGGPAVVFRY